MEELSYEVIEKRFQSMAGLATLDQTDKFFFKNTLNSRLRDAWYRAEWPELIEVKSFTLTTGNEGDKITADIDTDVLDVYDKHPYKDRTSKRIKYALLNGKVVLSPDYGPSEVFILLKKNFGVETREVFQKQNVGSNWLVINLRTGATVATFSTEAEADTKITQLDADATQIYYSDFTIGSKIPSIFENYLTSSILSDFYRGDGQSESALREENRAEEMLLRQLDRVERLQQQNRPNVHQYNINSPYGLTYKNI
jgi:hypothetical protein